jgi:homoaconitate hydratase
MAMSLRAARLLGRRAAVVRTVVTIPRTADANLSQLPSSIRLTRVATQSSRLNFAPRAFTTTATRYDSPEVFHSLKEGPAANFLGTFQETPKTPQTLTEKIVQRHAVGVAEGKVIRRATT